MHTTVLRATHPGFSDIATALHLHQKRLRLQPDFEKVGKGLSDYWSKMEQKFNHISLTKIIQGVNKNLVQFKKLGCGLQKNLTTFDSYINTIFKNMQLIFDKEKWLWKSEICNLVRNMKKVSIMHRSKLTFTLNLKLNYWMSSSRPLYWTVF